MSTWTPMTKGRHEQEERSGKNAEDFLDEPRQHETDWEDYDEDQEDEE